MVKTHNVCGFLQEFEEIGSFISVASPVEIKAAFPFNLLDIMHKTLFIDGAVWSAKWRYGIQPDGSLARAKLRGLAVIRVASSSVRWAPSAKQSKKAN